LPFGAGMPLEGAQQHPCRHVPQPDRLVYAARKYAGAIGRERNQRNPLGMRYGGNEIDLARVLGTRGRHARANRQENQAKDQRWPEKTHSPHTRTRCTTDTITSQDCLSLTRSCRPSGNFWSRERRFSPSAAPGHDLPDLQPSCQLPICQPIHELRDLRLKPGSIAGLPC
jgi:hypothetical protein